MERKEIRILLTESSFTQLCKTGFYTNNRGPFSKTDIYITKSDMKEISTGKILEKEVGGEIFKFTLQDIGIVSIREILKRSPIYSEIANDIDFNK